MQWIFFPEDYWLGLALEISSPPSTWKLTEKVVEEAYVCDRRGVRELGGLSYARAEFKCRNASKSDEEALIVIYLQVPTEESMALPLSLRRREATDDRVSGFTNLVEAYQRLKDHNCDFTPRFIGSSHICQDDDALIPGGFFSYVVFTSVPGDALGTNTMGFDFGGYGKPRRILQLSEEDQKRCRKLSIQDGIFWALSAEERAEIRHQFEAAFR
ncbi:hypothetical protein ASPBRDRAFT_194002 [Aspergillus brasiliensis CBS 101740]|uniref:Uncharacterized protein n=1 Tax=Aspergillus brasiliensis (strain CBS 101740 / IMI 381727 / IBT 21946) TaxID=767769 RepID=A0A1L9UUW5_ASPBC|nr:hypothetical protein ASPBRDRAFT_194002 [Aspergillus brasiliensis CBS 101740]